MFCYAIDNADSFEYAKKLFDKVAQLKGKDAYASIFVGTKADSKDRKVLISSSRFSLSSSPSTSGQRRGREDLRPPAQRPLR